jgi:Ca2+-binding EF-hand superfamily protein
MQLAAIFKKADTNQDGKVNADELAALLATSEERCFLVHFRGYPRHL